MLMSEGIAIFFFIHICRLSKCLFDSLLLYWRDIFSFLYIYKETKRKRKLIYEFT